MTAPGIREEAIVRLRCKVKGSTVISGPARVRVVATALAPLGRSTLPRGRQAPGSAGATGAAERAG